MRIFTTTFRTFFSLTTTISPCLPITQNTIRFHSQNLKERSLFFLGAGERFEKMGKYGTALKFHAHSLKSGEFAYGKKSTFASMQHERIARCYEMSGNKKKALEHRKKSIFWRK